MERALSALVFCAASIYMGNQKLASSFLPCQALIEPASWQRASPGDTWGNQAPGNLIGPKYKIADAEPLQIEL